MADEKVSVQGSAEVSVSTVERSKKEIDDVDAILRARQELQRLDQRLADRQGIIFSPDVAWLEQQALLEEQVLKALGAIKELRKRKIISDGHL